MDTVARYNLRPYAVATHWLLSPARARAYATRVCVLKSNNIRDKSSARKEGQGRKRRRARAGRHACMTRTRDPLFYN